MAEAIAVTGTAGLSDNDFASAVPADAMGGEGQLGASSAEDNDESSGGFGIQPDEFHDGRCSPFLSNLQSIWRTVQPSPLPETGIGKASRLADLWAIGRLRYALYVERDGKSYAADHSAKVFLEQADMKSLHFAARRSGEVVAAVRATRTTDAVEDPFMARLIASSQMPESVLADSAVISRLVVVNDTAARMQMVNLIGAVFQAGLDEGVACSLIAARPDMAPMFVRFGYLPVGSPYADPDAGTLVPHVLYHCNAAYLNGIRSPLLRASRPHS